MIYLVTNNQPLFESPNYKYITVDESLELLCTLSVIGVDTETEGLDPYTCKLLLLQLGNADFQIVIDCTTINVLKYKKFLEQKNRIFIFWNAKFDLKFLLHQGIIVTNIYDGYLAEKLLFLGIPAGIHKMSLAAAAKRYVNITMDKSVRNEITSNLTEKIVKYSAMDVEYLETIGKHQLAQLEENDLLKAINFENKFCPVLAYTEYCGVKIDSSKWNKKTAENIVKLQECADKLNSWVLDNMNKEPYTYYEAQTDMFNSDFCGRKCGINWSSSKQVGPLLLELGLQIKVRDEKTGLIKLSIEGPVLEAQKDKSELIPIYLQYKKYFKEVTTYGYNVTSQVNKISRRLHTNFNQLGTDTGRLASGGSDKINNTKYLNFQNFPADRLTRSCFISDKNHKWISCDYSGQESRIIADTTKDKALLNLFNHGCGDVHSLTAKLSFPDIIGDCPVEEIKSKFKKYRQKAKGVEFTINYGGSEATLANDMGKELAHKVYTSYMEGFKGIKEYQDRQREFVNNYGYIVLNPILGHKAYIYNFEIYKAVEKRFNMAFWSERAPFKVPSKELRFLPKDVLMELLELFANGESIATMVNHEYFHVKKSGKKTKVTKYTLDETDVYNQPVKFFFKFKALIEKHAINYPCQGTGAVMFKQASIYLFNYLIQNNLLHTVKLCIPAHDEWNIEVPEEMVENMTVVLQDCMKKAGADFCTGLELPADAEVNDFWVH